MLTAIELHELHFRKPSHPAEKAMIHKDGFTEGLQVIEQKPGVEDRIGKICERINRTNEATVDWPLPAVL